MEYLHAYWRLPYVQCPTKPVDRDNPFDKIPQTQDDRCVHLLYRGPHSYLVLNIFPYNAGHLMAIPYRSVQDLGELTSDEQIDLMATIIKGQAILNEAMQPHGFNIGMNIGAAAGAGIPKHLHVHIVPRWNGDTNFMPVIASTKTLPQALDHLWDRLKPIADKLSS